MFDRITTGVCYYPEHWDRNIWENDLERMKRYGISVVRIAEFAWDYFEPSEGIYKFDFFDDFLELAAQKDMNVIMCTPTATPPVWLTDRYPEVLNVDGDGIRMTHGTRRHANLNSEKFLQASADITEQLAKHYGSNPCVIGWQIDNEINCEMDRYFSESDQKAFVEYLKDKYKSLDELNRAMGTVFWNQTYTDWNQIKLAHHTNTGDNNPHMELEIKRFVSDTCVKYIKMQSRILRKYSGERFITTNGLFNNLDYHSLIGIEDGLDFITYDNYPQFAYGCWHDVIDENELNDRDAVYNLTRARSISGQFGIMEQQSGAGGWTGRMEMPMPRPGQMKLWAFSAIAEGADFVSFFRWRTAPFGTEIYWHGINDYSNRDNRRLRELSDYTRIIEKLQPVWNSRYDAQVGIVCDYDNSFDGDIDLWHGPLRAKSVTEIIKAFEFNHITYDFVNMTDELDSDALGRYELLIYPHASIVTPKRTKLLEKYVAEGGKLIFGCRSGYKDIEGHCVMMPMPGLLANLCGVEVDDYTFVSPDIKELCVDTEAGALPAPVFSDILKVTTAKVIGEFSDNYYKGCAGLTVNNYGEGEVYYFGGGFKRETVEGLWKITGITKRYAELFEISEKIQLTARKNNDNTYIFLLNYDKVSTTVHINQAMNELTTGDRLDGDIAIEAYGVRCFVLN